MPYVSPPAPSSSLTALKPVMPLPPTPPTRPSPVPNLPIAPTAPPTTRMADGLPPNPSNQLYKRPDPPTLRVLEPLMPTMPTMPSAGSSSGSSSGSGSSQHRSAPGVLVVEEEEVDPSLIEADEFASKGKVKGGGGRGRKGKLTAEMKRRARDVREAVRDERAHASRREKEEIFEVGDEGMSLEALAELIQVDPSDIVRTLFLKGILLSMNQVLDKNTCKVVAGEYDLLVVDKDSAVAKKKTDFVTEDDIDDLVTRPPVVTVMGHVDHGKTSLLDYIRKSRVAAGEAGGITQAIGAYNTTVEVEGEERTICFLDTPGHEAFSAMRARGAMVTDIAIIIVAADDGVRPQTREAVAHAQAAGVPIVVAINKVDKPGADVERVKQELLDMSLVPEEWGGTVPVCLVSAKKGTGIPELLTQVWWVAEEKQLTSNPKRSACGTVIEAHMDKRSGAVATLLIQAGTLRPGDIVRAGATYGRVRTLLDDLSRPIDSAGPSIAVQMLGLSSVPVAGEEFQVHSNESEAREAAAREDLVLKKQRLSDMAGSSSVTLSSLATIDGDEETEALQKLNLVLRADTSGMLEAIKGALFNLPQVSVSLRFLLAAAGDITVSDVDLASASNALILGFNLTPNDQVEASAKVRGVKIMTYKIIYELIDDVKTAMEGKLKAVEERVPLGKAEVKAVFGAGKKRVAGCLVVSGKLSKGSMISVKRGKAVVYEGKVTSLRRIKDAVDEVTEGTECGLGADFPDWAEKDVIECYQPVTKYRKLEEARASSAVDLATLN